MRVLFSIEAESELLDAQAWYEEKANGLGLEFARAADVAVASAMRSPASYPQIDRDFRRVLFRKFPFALIYSATESELLVVSVFHHRREPNSWRVN